MPSVIRCSDNFDTAGGNAVKAWVNFNGTGTVAIRAAFNVSSITDNGVGQYTVNFTTAMPDANYAIATDGATVSQGFTGQQNTNAAPDFTPLTTACKVVTSNSISGNFIDYDRVFVAIFR